MMFVPASVTPSLWRAHTPPEELELDEPDDEVDEEAVVEVDDPDVMLQPVHATTIHTCRQRLEVLMAGCCHTGGRTAK
jgi:hypothetical protein